MNSGITLTDVRAEAFDAIKKLKDGNMDVKTAQEIRGLLNTVIDTARTQVSFINALPDNVRSQLSADEVKAIAGTLTDRDAEMDITMRQIEKSQKRPYEIGN